MSYTSVCLQKFKSLPDDYKNKIGSIESLNAIKSLEVENKIELKFLVLLVAIGEVKIKDIGNYLTKKYQIEPAQAKYIKTELFNRVFSKLSPRKNKKDFKAELIKIFSGKLADIIKSNDELYNFEINEKIVFLLSSESDLKQDDLVKAMMENTEKLTDVDIIIDGSNYSGNVKNWISDFIKFHGTGMYDNVMISKYLSSSSNTKILKPEEKRIVQKLLILFRNLKFFPDSMLDEVASEWEIIPIDRNDKFKPKARTVSGPPRTEEEKRTEELKREGQKAKPGGLEQLAIAEELKHKQQADRLRVLVKQYKPGSLERKALEQEIKKLGN